MQLKELFDFNKYVGRGLTTTLRKLQPIMAELQVESANFRLEFYHGELWYDGFRPKRDRYCRLVCELPIKMIGAGLIQLFDRSYLIIADGKIEDNPISIISHFAKANFWVSEYGDKAVISVSDCAPSEAIKIKTSYFDYSYCL